MNSTTSNSAVQEPAPREASSEGFYSADCYNMQESVGLLLKRTYQSMMRSVDERMQVYDLTAMQWTPLFLIAKGYDTVAGCARHSNIDASSMTRMLDRLEAKSLIRRVRSATDRRVVNIELTESGRHIADQIPRELAWVLNRHLRGFSAEEFDTLKNLLHRFEANGTPEEV
ncbi:MAG TPA: MarR family transcriptional regulator [Burkholderiales bacterium]